MEALFFPVMCFTFGMIIFGLVGVWYKGLKEYFGWGQQRAAKDTLVSRVQDSEEDEDIDVERVLDRRHPPIGQPVYDNY